MRELSVSRAYIPNDVLNSQQFRKVSLRAQREITRLLVGFPIKKDGAQQGISLGSRIECDYPNASPTDIQIM